MAEVGHQRQQAEQHTGRRQQNGQQLRELNSEESHVSFPRPAGARRTGAAGRSFCKKRLPWQTFGRRPRELRLKACPGLAIRSANHRGRNPGD